MPLVMKAMPISNMLGNTRNRTIQSTPGEMTHSRCHVSRPSSQRRGCCCAGFISSLPTSLIQGHHAAGFDDRRHRLAEIEHPLTVVVALGNQLGLATMQTIFSHAAPV